MAIWINSKGKEYASTGPTAWLKRYVEQIIENLRTGLQLQIDNIPVRGEKNKTVAPSYGKTVTAEEGSTVIGDIQERVYDEKGEFDSGNVASGRHAIAMGRCTTATGNAAFASGYKSIASGSFSTAMGRGSKGSSANSFAGGYMCTASGDSSVAMGNLAIANGSYSVAMGLYPKAIGVAATALGVDTRASGNYSTSMGADTKAEGGYSIAGGYGCEANESCSVAFGNVAVANAPCSFAMGDGVVANAEEQMVHGRYNLPDENMLHIVGNGGQEQNRRNAYTLDKQGNGWFAGGVTVGGDKEPLATEKHVAEAIAQGVKQASKYTAEAMEHVANQVSNAVKGSSLSKALYLDDVSPLEHKVKVTVHNASDGENAIDDLSTVEVIRYGKNLCDRAYIADRDYWDFLDNSYDSIPIYVGKGNTVTVSYAEKITTNLGFYAAVMTKNSTADTYTTWLVHGSIPSLNNQVVTLTATEDYIYLRVSRKEIDTDKLVNFMEHVGNSLQVEIGTKATPYEEYIEPSYYAVSAEGTAEDVMSLSPGMTLIADTEGAVLEVEYNRDINKVIESLTNAIISLGGNV